MKVRVSPLHLATRFDRHIADLVAADEADAIVVGCSLVVAGPPWVPSSEQACSRCGEPIWLSERVEHAAAGRAELLCVPCVLAVVEDDGE